MILCACQPKVPKLLPLVLQSESFQAWLVSPRPAYKRQRIWFIQKNGQLRLVFFIIFITQFSSIFQFCFAFTILTIFDHPVSSLWTLKRQKDQKEHSRHSMSMFVLTISINHHGPWSWHGLTWNVPKPWRMIRRNLVLTLAHRNGSHSWVKSLRFCLMFHGSKLHMWSFRDRTIQKTWHSTSDSVRRVVRRNPWRICLLNFSIDFVMPAFRLGLIADIRPDSQSGQSWGPPNFFFFAPVPGMLIVTMAQTFPAKNTATFAILWTSHVEQLTVGMLAAKRQTFQLIESGKVM